MFIFVKINYIMANSKKKTTKTYTCFSRSLIRVFMALNANKSSIKKDRKYIHGSELTGTVK